MYCNFCSLYVYVHMLTALLWIFTSEEFFNAIFYGHYILFICDLNYAFCVVSFCYLIWFFVHLAVHATHNVNLQYFKNCKAYNVNVFCYNKKKCENSYVDVYLFKISNILAVFIKNCILRKNFDTSKYRYCLGDKYRCNWKASIQ